MDEYDDEPMPEGTAVKFTVPAPPPVNELVVNKLMALYPYGTMPYTSSDGGREREATKCRVIEVPTDDGDGKVYIDHGWLPIPWDQPRRELSKATPDAPWVLGTIVKRNVAYFLNPPKPSDVRPAQAAVSAFLADVQADREARAEAEKAAPAKPRATTRKATR